MEMCGKQLIGKHYPVYERNLAFLDFGINLPQITKYNCTQLELNAKKQRISPCQLDFK